MRVQLDAEARAIRERRPHAVLGLGELGQEDLVAILFGAQVLDDAEVRRRAGEVERRQGVGVGRDRKIEGVRQVGDLQPLGDAADPTEVRLDRRRRRPGQSDP